MGSRADLLEKQAKILDFDFSDSLVILMAQAFKCNGEGIDLNLQKRFTLSLESYLLYLSMKLLTGLSHYQNKYSADNPNDMSELKKKNSRLEKKLETSHPK